MESVYHCAESSGGDESIHPDFNGLWQFAGPGHWNDPDMLQVGNLEKSIEDRAHFSLWCILAAPLMAGNDLRAMSDTVLAILTAPEVIAINQDKRGHQGYKIFTNGDAEIYNKPLADGTAAVLMINKGDKPVNLTLDFSKIGLEGRQRVRDAWERRNLGYYNDVFTVENLSKNEHMLIRVGKKGSQLPGPEPLDPEKYTVSGNSYLSEIPYIVKQGAAPAVDTNFDGEKGLVCKSTSYLIYKLGNDVKRLKATVSIDNTSPETETGRFRVLIEDAFGGRPIFDSGKIQVGDEPKELDIDISGLDQILLEFTGKDMYGIWGGIKTTP